LRTRLASAKIRWDRVGGGSVEEADEMKELVAQSVLIALVAIPLLAALDRRAARGLKLTLLFYVGFCVAYTLALRFIYPHLS
jgi:hypothetical protein